MNKKVLLAPVEARHGIFRKASFWDVHCQCVITYESVAPEPLPCPMMDVKEPETLARNKPNLIGHLNLRADETLSRQDSAGVTVTEPELRRWLVGFCMAQRHPRRSLNVS